MKLLITLMWLFVGTSLFADTIDDVFNPGITSFAFEKAADNNIMLAIEKDAQIACKPNGQCILSSLQSDNKGWETSFNVGQGINYGNSAGTTIITGGYDTGSNNCNNCLPTHWGITISFHSTHCQQQILVPRSLYYAMNRYLYGLLQENGEPRKGFTPADETMIIFYSTIMKQASSTANCNTRY